MEIALKELGTHEIPGKQNQARILEYHAATSLHASDDETPWCSAFANFVLQKAGFKTTGSAWARSWLNYGVTLDKPVYGCLVIYERGVSSGHVNFFDHERAGWIYGLGGNQGDAVNISGYSKQRVLGYRWPVR